MDVELALLMLDVTPPGQDCNGKTGEGYKYAGAVNLQNIGKTFFFIVVKYA